MNSKFPFYEQRFKANAELGAGNIVLNTQTGAYISVERASLLSDAKSNMPVKQTGSSSSASLVPDF